jgi:hypothetical protein
VPLPVDNDGENKHGHEAYILHPASPVPGLVNQPGPRVVAQEGDEVVEDCPLLLLVAGRLGSTIDLGLRFRVWHRS